MGMSRQEQELLDKLTKIKEERDRYREALNNFLPILEESVSFGVVPLQDSIDALKSIKDLLTAQ